MTLRLNKLAIFPFAFLLAACAGPGTTPSGDLAPQESLRGESDTLTVYSGRSEELVAPVIQMFEKKTGIKVNVKYGETAELAALILEEGGNSPADVFFAQDAGALGAITKGDLLMKLPPDITQLVSAGFRAKDDNWVGITGRVRVVVYNTETVRASSLPNSIDGFTDPRWKDQIGWAPTNGSFQSFVTAYRKLKGEQAAKKWLTDIKANGANIYPKNAPIVEAAGAGEIQVGFVNHYYLLQIRSEKPGIKAENYFFSSPEAGSLVNVAGVGILKTSKAQITASRFVEYLLSEESQRYFVEETFEYPLIEGLDPPAGLPKLSELKQPSIDLSDLDDLQGTLDLLKEVGLL